jgi:hypothetical protein
VYNINLDRVMFMYKMIAMDMDGTLLTDNKQITERTKKVINLASKKGVKIAVCTGRIFASARIYAEAIGTKTPVIASNGAYIRDKDTNKVIYEKYLKTNEVLRLAELTKGYGFYPHFYTYNTIMSEKMVFSSKNYNEWNKVLPDDAKINIVICSSLKDKVLEYNGKIIKMVVASDEGIRINELRNKIQNESNLSVVSSFPNSFEVMPYGTSKGNGVKILADKYNISPEEVICVGDSENDISMIQYAGLGIAMGNATEDVKMAADYITDTNENEGVAKAIERFVLNN